MKSSFLLLVMKILLIALSRFARSAVTSLVFGISLLLASCGENKPHEGKEDVVPAVQAVWVAPDITALGNSDKETQIKYGKKLIENTAFYLGPNGTVARLTNGMNCQNCHLDAGTKPFGNNYGAVASTYPKFRPRSGSVESIYKRINDCVERSLNGQVLDTAGKEMQAIKAYIEWLGKDVPQGTKPQGSGISALPYLGQAANTESGKQVYIAKCAVCHGNNGEGKHNTADASYLYPPLWGPHSYTSGAGLYRLSKFASFVKSNMPFGASSAHPQLSDEEAWDVAAYVNSQPRPAKDISKDWPDISTKPFDHPFGPYVDSFSERQHKYGPYLPITEYIRMHAAK